MSNILFFAPYGNYGVHHQLDAVVARTLLERGHTVLAITCDGIFKSCPNAGRGEMEAGNCNYCAKCSSEMFEKLDVPCRPLSQFILESRIADLRTRISSLPAQELATYTSQDRPFGEWALISLYALYMTAYLDLEDPETVQRLRDSIVAAQVTWEAVTEVCLTFGADRFVCYNGDAYTCYKVAAEAVRKLGIPNLIHERGSVKDSFQLHERDDILDWSVKKEYLKHWLNVPLDDAQCREVHEFFLSRERGESLNWPGYYTFSPKAEEATLRRKLNIPRERRIVNFFVGSDWELVRMKKLFTIDVKDPVCIVRDVIDAFSDTNVMLVIRHHPFVYRYNGTPFLRRLIELAQERPDNVRVIMSHEETSAYSMIWNADCVITTGSTTGLEAVMRGVRAFSLADNCYNLAGVTHVATISELRDAVLRTLGENIPVSAEELRRSYRAAHFMFNKISVRFNAFGFKDYFQPDIRVAIPEGLRPMADPMLDRLVAHLVEGAELYPLPDSPDRRSDTSAETRFVEELSEANESKRRLVRESQNNAPFREIPAVSVVRLRRDMKDTFEDTALYRSLGCARYGYAELLQTPLAPGAEAPEIIQALINSVLRCSGEYVVFGFDSTVFDESFFPTMTQLLEDRGGEGFSSVRCGCWVHSGDGLQEYLPTPQESYVRAAPAARLWSDVEAYLPTLFFRTEALRRALSKAMISGIQTCAVFMGWMFGELSRMHWTELNVPLVTVMPKLSARELLVEADRAMENGDTDAAEQLLHRHLLIHRGGEPEAYSRLSRLRDGQGRTVEAFIFDEAARRAAGDEAQSAPAPEYDYTDIAPAVERVTGHLNPGQENWLFSRVRELPADALVLEMGSFMGRSTTAMAAACAGSGKHIVSVDSFTWSTPQGEDFLDLNLGRMRTSGLLQYVTHVRGLSDEMDLHWKWGRPDFIFIDAGHTFKDVRADFEKAFALAGDGVRIALHDVDPSWPGSFRLWRETASKVLDDHMSCSNISSGTKIPGAILTEPTDCFDFAGELADYIGDMWPKLERFVEAMRMLHSAEGRPVKEIHSARETMRELPEFLLNVIDAMVLSEDTDSPMLVYWLALAIMDRKEHRARETVLAQFEEILARSSESTDFLRQECTNLKQDY